MALVSLLFAKIGPMALRANVVDFVTAKAPNFNKIQQSSTGTPQTLQQVSLRINRIP